MNHSEIRLSVDLVDREKAAALHLFFKATALHLFFKATSQHDCFEKICAS